MSYKPLHDPDRPARERLQTLLDDVVGIALGMTDDEADSIDVVLNNLTLVLEAAREAGKAEQVGIAVEHFPAPDPEAESEAHRCGEWSWTELVEDQEHISPDEHDASVQVAPVWRLVGLPVQNEPEEPSDG